MSSNTVINSVVSAFVILSFAGAAKGASTVIDTFDQTPQVSNGGNVSILSGVTEALGGARDVYASGPSTTISGSSPGTFTIADTRGDTNYGVRIGGIGPQFNADWNAYVQFELELAAAPNGGVLYVSMHTLNNNQFVYWEGLTVPPSIDPFTLVVPFSAATLNTQSGGALPPQAAQLADVDGVGFRFDSANGLTALEWRVSDGVSVPEPGTGFFLALSMWGLLRRRSR